MDILNVIEIGSYIKEKRKSLGLTQADLANAAKVGVRFIVDLEKGKETSQIGKILYVCKMLGIKVSIN